MNKEKIAVFLSLDKAYLVPATVTIFSLLKNHPKQPFRIYLISEENDNEWINPLVNLIREMGSEPVLRPINGQDISKLKVNLHISHATYYRILAAKLIDESKVIYLDSDLVINGDIRELWEVDLGDRPVGAVQDLFIQDLHRLSLSKTQGYFNSGVLLMNLDQWRKMNLTDLVFDFAKQNPEIIPYLDQCSLNAVLKGNWLRLDPKWNVQTAMLDKGFKAASPLFFSEESLNEAKQNPRIIHFTGVYKPWNLGGEHPYKDLFWKYLNQIPHASKKPLNYSWLNLIKSWIPLSFKKSYWRFLRDKKLFLLSGIS